MNDSHTRANLTTPPAETPTTATARWRLPLLLAVVLVVVVPVANSLLNRREEQKIAPATGQQPPAAASEPAATGQAVSLTIDFADRPARNWPAIAWHEGMTVADVLTAAVNTPENPIEFVQQGSGERAFLTRLGDQANEGEGGRNWTYAVNDKRADRSFAIYTLQPGDQVLWKFGPPR